MCMTVVLLTEKQIKDEIDRLLNDEFDDDDGFFMIIGAPPTLEPP